MRCAIFAVAGLPVADVAENSLFYCGLWFIYEQRVKIHLETDQINLLRAMRPNVVLSCERENAPHCFLIQSIRVQKIDPKKSKNETFIPTESEQAD